MVSAGDSAHAPGGSGSKGHLKSHQTFRWERWSTGNALLGTGWLRLPSRCPRAQERLLRQAPSCLRGVHAAAAPPRPAAESLGPAILPAEPLLPPTHPSTAALRPP